MYCGTAIGNKYDEIAYIRPSQAFCHRVQSGTVLIVKICDVKDILQKLRTFLAVPLSDKFIKILGIKDRFMNYKGFR